MVQVDNNVLSMGDVSGSDADVILADVSPAQSYQMIRGFETSTE
jgi:hypothetical protein